MKVYKLFLKGRVKIRAKTHFEDEDKDKAKIVITEMPYQVNKSKLIEKIAELSRDKKIEGVRDIRDESDKDGVRVVIDLKSGQIPDVLLNNLFAQTQMPQYQLFQSCLIIYCIA